MKAWTTGLALLIGAALLLVLWGLRSEDSSSAADVTPPVVHESDRGSTPDPVASPSPKPPTPLLEVDARDTSDIDESSPAVPRPPLDVFALSDDLHHLAYDMVNGNADADALFALTEALVAQLADGRAPDRIENGVAVYELSLVGEESVTLRSWPEDSLLGADFSLSVKLGTAPGALSGFAADGAREATLELGVSVDEHGVPSSFSSITRTNPRLTSEFFEYLTSVDRAAPGGATLRVMPTGAEWRRTTTRPTLADGEPAWAWSMGDAQVVPGSLVDPRATSIARTLERTRPAVDGY